MDVFAMERRILGSPKVILVTGKGGVGKSTIAAGLAVASAKSGQRTLLVEFAEQSYFRYFFSLPTVGFEGSSLESVFPETEGRLDLSCWKGQESLKEYIAHVMKVGSLTNLFFDSPVMKAFIDAAPALSDVALLGKLTSRYRNVGPQLKYDVVVVDAFAAGHAIAMLKAPKSLAEAVQVGPMGEQCREITAAISDNSFMNYWVVALPEILPVTEAIELAQDIEKEVGLKPRVLLNRCSQDVDLSDLSEEYKKSRGEFCQYLQKLNERKEKSLEFLKNAGLPVATLEHSFKTGNINLVRDLSEALQESIN